MDLVFMFMQKSMAACRSDKRISWLHSAQNKAACQWSHTSPHFVYQVSVDTVGQLLDEGVHDELQVRPCVGFLILLFYM